MCYKSGVTHVTIYAFSIENFKRSKYEVDALMDMAKIKLTQLSQHGDLLDRYGAKVRILGHTNLLKPDVLEAMNRAVNTTARNNQTILNICFPYTSRDEIATAIRSTVEEYAKPMLQPQPSKSRRGPFTEQRIRKTVRSQTSKEDLGPRSSHEFEATHSLAAQDTHVAVPIPNIQEEDIPDLADDSSVASTNTNSHPQLSSPTTESTSTSYTSSPQQKPIHDHDPPSYETLRPTQSTSYLSADTITSQTITNHLFTKDDPPLDLLVRTSGVERLSDFMLWQCHETTSIVFLDVLWPEFDLWSFLPVLWEWQWRRRKQEQRELEGQQERITRTAAVKAA